MMIPNTATASVRWHPLTNPTATSGQIIPPILPTETASPDPLVLIEVGYTYNGARGIQE